MFRGTRGIYLSELKTLGLISIVTGFVIGLSAYFLFKIPDLFCIALGVVTTVLFFMVILWTSYIFVHH